MRSFLIVCLAATVIATVASADVRIGLYSDEAASSCNLFDTSTQVISVYVIQTGGSGKAAEYMLAPRNGASLTYVAESLPRAGQGTLGRADIGAAVLYGGCVEPPVHIMTVFYQGLGVSANCGEIAILNHPDSNQALDDHVGYVVCADEYAWAAAGDAVVNPDDSCECETDPGGIVTPVQTATWGAVKSLYVD